MLELLICKDWTVNSDAIMSYIAQDVSEEKGNRILLVPELISHDTERRLCESAGDSVSRFASVTGFSRLPGLIARYNREAVPACLDQAGCVAAMASAARQLHGSLKAYASVESRPEFLTQMVDAVDEFKRCCISAQDLLTASQNSTGQLSEKLQELSMLLQTYDAICSLGKRDPRDLLNWALEALEDCDFAENHVIYVDGFPDFTRQHMAILEHFILHSPRVVIALNCDRPDSNKYAFSKAGQTAKALLDFARKNNIPFRQVELAAQNDRLAPVRDKLFQGQIIPDPGLADAVKLYTADSLQRECQAAAEDVRQLIANGARYRDIAVVCTDMQRYRPALGLNFRRLNIPFYLSGTELVSDSFVMNTLFAAMESVQSGFEKSAMRRYLRSALSVLDADTCDLVENYAYIWNIQGNDWKNPWTKHPAGLETKWRNDDYKHLAKLESARQCVINPLLRLQTGFQNATKVSDQVQALYAFLEDIRFAERMEDLAASMDAQGDNRSAQMLNQLWDILLTALEQLADILGNTSWDSEVFGKLLTLILSQYDVGTIPTVLDAVTVGPVSAMRCQRPKYLLILGCAEGLLPGYAGGNSVLTDGERNALRMLNVPLTGGSMDGIQVEFSEVYGVFCGVTHGISLYCSDAQPSFVYRRVRDMVGANGPFNRDEEMLGNDYDAAGYLLRFNDAKAAQNMGLDAAYTHVRTQRGYELGKISKENVVKLYGDTLHLSATKVDNFASCRLKFFLQHGLALQERKEATIDGTKFGEFVHHVLEYTVKEIISDDSENKKSFHDISYEEISRIAQKHIDRYVADHFSQIESNRLQYLLQRNLDELALIIHEVWDELRLAKYTPVATEFNFTGREGKKADMPPIDIPNPAMSACLDGKVDRIDIYNHESGKQYFRVVDYKTGDVAIDYCDILCGVGLQMFLYLFALQENGSVLLNADAIPAGVQYFRAKVPHVTLAGAEDHLAPNRENGWEHSGLLLNDDISIDAMDPTPELTRLSCKRNEDGVLEGNIASGAQFKQLKQYIFSMLKDFVVEIADGNVTPNPYVRGSDDDLCKYCPYGTVCNHGHVPGMRNFRAIKKDEFWETIGKAGEDNG